MIDGRAQKPWFLFFYNKKCDICQRFKPEFEKIAAKLNDIATFGMLDLNEVEDVREAYGIGFAPFLAFVKDDKFYLYDNARKLEAVRSYINQDHKESPKGRPLVGRKTFLETQYKRLKMFVEYNVPEWNRQMDSLLFKHVGLKTLAFEYKVIIATGIFWLLTLIFLILLDMAICRCFFKSARSKKKKE